jgi:hypothetical protein
MRLPFQGMPMNADTYDLPMHPIAIIENGRLIPLDQNGLPIRTTPLPTDADPTTLALADIAHALRQTSSRILGLRDLACDISVTGDGARLHFRATA